MMKDLDWNFRANWIALEVEAPTRNCVCCVKLSQQQIWAVFYDFHFLFLKEKNLDALVVLQITPTKRAVLLNWQGVALGCSTSSVNKQA